MRSFVLGLLIRTNVFFQGVAVFVTTFQPAHALAPKREPVTNVEAQDADAP